MTFGSLFSGQGGFDLGLEQAGHRCLWQVENDPHCIRVLEKHWPEVKRYADIQTVKGSDLAPVDLICGGFPCTDLSVAGRRAGLAGERSGLWFEFHRILLEMRPRFALIENVPGLLSVNGGRDFAVILRGLVNLGYCVAWRILDSRYFGVAQRRRRVFIVASIGTADAPEILLEPPSLCGNPAASREAGAGLAASLRGRTASDGVSMPGRGGEDYVNVVLIQHAMQSTRDKRQNGMGVGSDGDPAYTLGVSEIGGVMTYWDGGVVGTLDASTGGLDDNMAQAGQLIATPIRVASPSRHAGGSSPVAGHLVPFIDAYAVRGSSSPNQYPVKLDGVSDALDTTGPGAVLAPGACGVRRLTPVECLRLQNFPDDWFDGLDLADTHKYRMVGNAVTVSVIKWIGERLP